MDSLGLGARAGKIPDLAEVAKVPGFFRMAGL
jgi:hypothetical protein